jgi:parallel beta-helix repeat protein
MGARTALIMVVAGATATLGAIGAGAGAGAAASPLQCGATVTHNVTLRSDLLGCPGDGLIIGAAGVKVDLHGFTIGGSKTAGSAGIRDQGYAGLQVVGGGLHATIQDFEVGVLVSHGATPSISAIATRSVTYGVRLDSARGATIRGNDVGFFEVGPALDTCSTATAPAAILLVDSDRALVRDNRAELSGFGIVLVRSDDAILRNNGAAPLGSDGNVCSGIVLVDSARATLVGNTTTENRSGKVGGGDGIFVDAASPGAVLRENVALTNTDDGIDVERSGTKLVGNRADDNDDLGIEAVPGVRGSGNTATGNHNPAQCVGIVCS